MLAAEPWALRPLVGADRGGIDVDVPVDMTRCVGDGLDVLEQPFPGAVCRPHHLPLVMVCQGPKRSGS